MWVLARDGEVPPNAVIGGHEGRVTLYVARFYTKKGYLSPGKLHPPCGKAYNGNAGEEHSSNVYQVLTHPDQNRGLVWVPSKGGVIPAGALQGGIENSHPLYIGRGMHDHKLICGKVRAEKLWLPYYGKEIGLSDDFEVLCVTSVNMN